MAEKSSQHEKYSLEILPLIFHHENEKFMSMIQTGWRKIFGILVGSGWPGSGRNQTKFTLKDSNLKLNLTPMGGILSW